MTQYVHPVVAGLCFLCGVYALFSGIRGRTRAVRSPGSVKQHESFGSVALGGFIFAAAIGLGYTFQNRHVFIPFREHFFAALPVLPFAVIGLISGHILSAKNQICAKNRRARAAEAQAGRETAPAGEQSAQTVQAVSGTAFEAVPGTVSGAPSGEAASGRGNTKPEFMKEPGHRALALVHGICMLVCLVLACRAVYTGIGVLKAVVGK